MKVCFVGLGSIAKRHIRNLKEILDDTVDITVARRKKNAEIESPLKDMISHIISYEDELAEQYDAIFITNPTSLHYETLKKYLRYSNFFFIEKPVFLTGEEEISAFMKKEKTFYIACPLRYTNVIQYLKDSIDLSLFYSIRCISSSYLPEWRVGIDYRNTYSAHRDMGGGVCIDLIHEWDYLHYLIGAPINIKSIIGKKSELEIDSDDIAVYIAEYPNKIVELHLDYFGRKTIRKIELIGKTDTIIADLIEQKIEWLSERKVIDLSQTRDEYQKLELIHFLNIVGRKCNSDNDLKTACRILRIARGGE